MKYYRKRNIKKNPLSKKLFLNLYKKTIERENIIKSNGYNLVIVWECQDKC
jgi:G:T-mismatch repair DNA endonuclease (very short patch repair protein)